jgi:4-amino-4-deoxy-L-arabinose transferase-like glycosyltransferase
LVTEGKAPGWIAATLPAGLGVLGAIMVTYTTAWGPWAYSDGVGYLVSARNLIEGVGLGLIKPSGEFEPLISHPPLYPLTLAGLMKLGLTELAAARLIDAAAFAGLVAGAGWLVGRLTGRLRWGLAASGLLLVMPAIFLLYVAAMAEALFLTAGTLSLLALALAIDRGSLPWLIASAALASLAVLARYPGAVYGLLGVAGAAVSWRGARSRRLATLSYAAIAFLPLVAFLVLSATLRGAGSPRQLIIGRQTEASLAALTRQLVGQLWTWKPLPDSGAVRVVLGVAEPMPMLLFIAGVLLLGLGLLALGLAQRTLRRLPLAQPAAGTRWLGVVSAAFCLLYLAFVAGSYFLTYPTLDINSRTLLPLAPAFIMLGLALLASWTAGPPLGTRWLQLGASLMLAASLAAYLVPTLDMVRGLNRTGSGYTARAWQQSPTIRALQASQPAGPLISNEPEAILLYLNRYPHDLNQWLLDRAAQGESLLFGCGDSDLEQLFRQPATRLILVSPGGWTGLDEERLARATLTRDTLCAAIELASFDDGSLHASSAPAAP